MENYMLLSWQVLCSCDSIEINKKNKSHRCSVGLRSGERELMPSMPLSSNTLSKPSFQSHVWICHPGGAGLLAQLDGASGSCFMQPFVTRTQNKRRKRIRGEG